VSIGIGQRSFPIPSVLCPELEPERGAGAGPTNPAYFRACPQFTLLPGSTSLHLISPHLTPLYPNSPHHLASCLYIGGITSPQHAVIPIPAVSPLDSTPILRSRPIGRHLSPGKEKKAVSRGGKQRGDNGTYRYLCHRRPPPPPLAHRADSPLRLPTLSTTLVNTRYPPNLSSISPFPWTGLGLPA
jgi:hypothetical protein